MSKPFKCEFFYNLGELTLNITWYSLEKKVIHLSAIPDDFGSKWDGIVPEEAIRKLL